MVTVHLAVGIAVIATNLVAGRLGRDRLASPVPSRRLLVRAAHRPGGGRAAGRARRDPAALGPRGGYGLHYLYGVLPLLVSLLAEGARAGAAERELEGSTSSRCRRSASGASRWRSSAARPGSWPSRRWSIFLLAPARPRRTAGSRPAPLGATGLSQTAAVLALVEQQRLAVDRLQFDHGPGDDRVVAAVVHLASSHASQISAPSIIGTPARSDQPIPSHFSGWGSLVLNRRATSAWSPASTLMPNLPRVLDRDQGARAEVEAGEHHRRLERQRGDGVGRRAGRAGGSDGGDDGDAGREARHRVPQGLGLDLRHLADRLHGGKV